jgi:hypothetical protein
LALQAISGLCAILLFALSPVERQVTKHSDRSKHLLNDQSSGIEQRQITASISIGVLTGKSSP